MIFIENEFFSYMIYPDYNFSSLHQIPSPWSSGNPTEEETERE